MYSAQCHTDICLCGRGGDENNRLYTTRLLAVTSKSLWSFGNSIRRGLDISTNYFKGKYYGLYFKEWLKFSIYFQNDLSYFFGFMVVILRFFTITGKHTTLKMLMLTVGVSVCKSFFIIFGMFLLVFFYALAGTILFGKWEYKKNCRFVNVK